jgi:hypothetical protein
VRGRGALRALRRARGRALRCRRRLPLRLLRRKGARRQLRRTRFAAADVDQEGYDSATSSCVSTADPAPRGRVPGRPRAEAVLEG